MVKSTTFENLSSQVNETQRKILDAIWHHYLAKDQWPSDKRIHHNFGKQVVQTALKPLGGTIVRQILNASTYRYQLEFLGLLLTDQGSAIERLLVQYLEFLRGQFHTDPDQEMISHMDVQAFFDLTPQQLSPEQISLLGKAIRLSSFLSGSGNSGFGWTARFPSDIDEWTSDLDFVDYVRARAMERYDPTYPIDDRGRELHFIGKPESTKEREQKFKILWSPDQAKKDFDDWSEELKSGRQPIAIGFVDIDYFKALNTKYGHPQIDKTILPEAQQMLVELVRYRGEAYKHGGDEFLLALPNHTETEARDFAERVRSTFEHHLFSIEGETIKLTVSIGISTWPEDGVDYDQVLQMASETNGKAKLTRNTVAVASARKFKSTNTSSERVSEALDRKAAEEANRKALKRAKGYSVS